MARLLRIEFAGGVYHITARGNAWQDIYADSEDRVDFLALIEKPPLVSTGMFMRIAS